MSKINAKKKIPRCTENAILNHANRLGVIVGACIPCASLEWHQQEALKAAE